MILVGERMATVPGALSAVATLAATTGAKLAWVPRRAGDRGAVEAGCLPNLLPGGRPVADAAARVDVGTAWGVDGLPEEVGRDADGIVAALVAGDLGGLVVGGVDPDDTADPAATRAALAAARFVVALELRETDVTRAADVVFPVAPVTDKAGMFVTWEGRPAALRPGPGEPRQPARPAGAGRHRRGAGPAAGLPHRRRGAHRDGVARSLGRRASVRRWPRRRPRRTRPRDGTFALATWKQLIDLGSMQDGQDAFRATARRPVAKLSRAAYDALGATVTLTGDRGSVTLPAEVGEGMPDGVVWVPANSFGNGVLADLASPGSRVSLREASPLGTSGPAIREAT